MWTDPGLFTKWKIGFDPSPRLHDLKCLVLELFHFVISSSLWRTDTIVILKLNKPPSQISSLSLLSPPSNGLEINKPPGGLNNNRGFTVSIIQVQLIFYFLVIEGKPEICNS